MYQLCKKIPISIIPKFRSKVVTTVGTFLDLNLIQTRGQ